MNTGCGGSSAGSTTPSNWVHRGLRWGRSSPRAHTATTPPITTASIPGSGDDADFDYVVAEAHRRGLRVLLDGVFNHVGVDFPRYREAPNNDAAARWFRGRPGRFSHRSKATPN